MATKSSGDATEGQDPGEGADGASMAAAVLMTRQKEGLHLLERFSSSLKRLSEANTFLGEEEEKLLIHRELRVLMRPW